MSQCHCHTEKEAIEISVYANNATTCERFVTHYYILTSNIRLWIHSEQHISTQMAVYAHKNCTFKYTIWTKEVIRKIRRMDILFNSTKANRCVTCDNLHNIWWTHLTNHLKKCTGNILVILEPEELEVWEISDQQRKAIRKFYKLGKSLSVHLPQTNNKQIWGGRSLDWLKELC